MQFICGKCLNVVDNPEEMEGAEGFTYHCTHCGAPVAYQSFEDLEHEGCCTSCDGCAEEVDYEVEYDADIEDDDSVTVTLSNDQVTYLKHIIFKQLDKLDNATQQLEDTLTALGGDK